MHGHSREDALDYGVEALKCFQRDEAKRQRRATKPKKLGAVQRFLRLTLFFVTSGSRAIKGVNGHLPTFFEVSCIPHVGYWVDGAYTIYRLRPSKSKRMPS